MKGELAKNNKTRMLMLLSLKVDDIKSYITKLV